MRLLVSKKEHKWLKLPLAEREKKLAIMQKQPVAHLLKLVLLPPAAEKVKQGVARYGSKVVLTDDDAKKATAAKGCKERDDVDDDIVFVVGEPGEVVYDGAKEIKKEIKKARGGSVKVVTRKGEKLGKGVHPMVSDRAREADEAAAGKPQIKESQLLAEAATKVEEPDTMIRQKKIGDHARVKLPPSVSDKAFDDEFRRGAAIDHAKHAAGEAGSAIGDKLEEAKNVAGEKAESIKSDVEEGAHDFASESERKAEKIKSGAVDAARGAKEGVEYAGQAVA
ncbi:unnamed protein product, partial [Gongylonema pulchrum]|uniref:DUF4604 domain-containing protein n=1 Tax=Gongylonema pulchrum TaxID=637853 RepID=A0A183CXE0_9BILA